MKLRLLFVIGSIFTGVASLAYLFMPMSLMALFGITLYLNEKIS